jgi:hypothetical protein
MSGKAGGGTAVSATAGALRAGAGRQGLRRAVRAAGRSGPYGDQALAQDVLHRLAQAQVGREREYAEKYG